jgi:hypothetical protein
MKKLFLCLVAITLSGCVDLTTPESTVKSLGYTIIKNKFGTYHSILMGDARSQYGSRQQFDTFRAEADQFKNAKVGEAKMTSSEAKRVFLKVYAYEVPVDLGSNKSAIATTICVENYGYDPIYPEDVVEHLAFAPPMPPVPRPIPEPLPPRMEWYYNCQISDLTFN